MNTEHTVIDPEDDEQTKALWHMAGQTLPTFRAALREFADPKPPKPEEPLAFSAAVEDVDGVWWTRTGTGPRSGDWCNAHGDHLDYADLDVVRVLSKGVRS